MQSVTRNVQKRLSSNGQCTELLQQKFFQDRQGWWARFCAQYKAYTVEQTWRSIRDVLQGPSYLSRDDHDHKIRASKQRTDIGKYCCVNRTIELWRQLPAEALATFPCKSHIFRRKFRELIVSEEKWRVFEKWWRNVQKCRDVKNGEWSVVKCSEVNSREVKWSDVMILDDMCVLSLIYGYVAVCKFCAVRCVINICFCLLFYHYSTYVFFNIPFMFVFVLYFCFLLRVFCVFVLVVLFQLLCSLFPIFVQVYRLLQQAANSIAVNK